MSNKPHYSAVTDCPYCGHSIEIGDGYDSAALCASLNASPIEGVFHCGDCGGHITSVAPRNYMMFDKSKLVAEPPVGDQP
jgi:hypothetical protein